MKSTVKISKYINTITQENLLTNRIVPNLSYSYEDDWRRLKHYAY
ncbi:hypothetical protein [Flavivirga eckloniae]|nr:hypothetical protein [Flavivirga eckloniae]